MLTRTTLFRVLHSPQITRYTPLTLYIPLCRGVQGSGAAEAATGSGRRDPEADKQLANWRAHHGAFHDSPTAEARREHPAHRRSARARTTELVSSCNSPSGHYEAGIATIAARRHEG